MFNGRRVRVVADSITAKTHGKIKPKNIYETKDPTNEDDMIYINDSIMVQVGLDYFLVSAAFKNSTGNTSFAFWPIAFDLDTVIGYISDGLKGKLPK